MSEITTGPWGPYHDHIGEGLAHCADYLGRLQASLAGEIAPDRHYFTAKAGALRDASVGLLRRARDAERWLGSCEAAYGSEGGSCALPAGHDGAHGDGPTPAQRLAERAEALTAVATEVADILAWATFALDAGDDGPELTDALADAARRLGQLRRGAGELAERVEALASRP